VYSVSLCSSVYVLCVNVYWTTVTGISGHFSTTLTEVVACFSFSCNANTRVKFAKTGHVSHLAFFLFIVMYVPFSVFCVLFVCNCVPYYCHRVSTQLKLKVNNILILSVSIPLYFINVLDIFITVDTTNNWL
jgi:hypothetical protein